jgi:predicted small secreted protein
MKRKIALLGSLAMFAILLAACAQPTPERIIETVR